MPSSTVGRTLCAAAALGLTAVAPARAQDKPVDLGSPGQSLEDLTGEQSHPLQVTGFGVGDYRYDALTGDNSARAGKLALAVFREIDDRLWFFGQLTTALATGDAAAGDEVPTEIEIDNLLVNFTPGGASGMSLAFGKFDVPLGFERDDEPLNLQATNSFNYELGRPAKMVGMVGRWALSPHVDLTAVGGNGWNAQVDPNHGKTGGFRIGVLPTEHASLGLGGLYGNEGQAGAPQNRWLLTADYALEGENGRWILGGEANLGGEPGALGDGGNAGWYGATLSLFRRLSDHTGATLRAETFRDRNGVRTGEVQTLQSLTFTPMVFLGSGQEGIFANVEHTTFRIPRFQVRGDLRLDHSSLAAFEDADGALHSWSTRFILQLVTTF